MKLHEVDNRLLKQALSVFNPGDVVVFNYCGIEKQAILEYRNGQQFFLKTPDGQKYTVWFEDVRHKLERYVWPGIADSILYGRVDSSKWKETILEMLSVANAEQKQAIMSLISAIQFGERERVRLGKTEPKTS